MRMQQMLLLLLLCFGLTAFGMEEQAAAEQEVVHAKSDAEFSCFTDLPIELQILILSQPIYDAIDCNVKPIKALKKALSFLHSIKTLNKLLYTSRSSLYDKLRGKMAEKFRSDELINFSQEQKNDLLKFCLSDFKEMEFRDQYPKSESEIIQILENFKSKSLNYILAGADPMIVLNFFLNNIRHMSLTPNTIDCFSDTLFLAMTLGAKLDVVLDKLESVDSYEALSVKRFIIFRAAYAHNDKLLKIIKFILKSNFDPDTESYLGDSWTLLHEAAYHSRLKLTKLLLDFGAEKNLRTTPHPKEDHPSAKLGYSAFDLAKVAYDQNPTTERKEIVELLSDTESKEDTKCKKPQKSTRCLVS